MNDKDGDDKKSNESIENSVVNNEEQSNKKTEESMPSTEPTPLNTENFFFKLKNKDDKKTYTKREMEVQYELEKIKKAHKPMDYKKLKKHETSFMAEMMIRRKQRQEEMAENLKKLESSYKISFKSKVHDNFENSYIDNRYFFKKKRDKSSANRDHSRNYSEKIKEMNILEPDNINVQKSQEKKYVKEGVENKEWFYGRFGKREWKDECERNVLPKYMTNRQEVGNSFMDFNKSHRLKGEELNKSIEQKRLEKKKEKEQFILKKSRDKNYDYLNSVKRQNRENFRDFSNRLPLANSQDIKTLVSGRRKPMQDCMKSLCLDRIKKFDEATERKEERIRLKVDKSAFVTRSQSFDVGEKIEDYYIESIKAKLSLLDELKQSDYEYGVGRRLLS